MLSRRRRRTVLALFLALAAMPAAAAEDIDAGAARVAAERAATFFAEVLGGGGAYDWAYRPDGSFRSAEGDEVMPGVGYVQPPGTPAVGVAFLRLHLATGDPRWLDAAGRAAHALVDAQLMSGGWFIRFDTDPERRARWCYRTNGLTEAACAAIDGNLNKNRAVLDDNVTPGAIAFLLWYDRVVEGRDVAVREAMDAALTALAGNIYPGGGCPVRLPAPGLDKAAPTATARAPQDWRREWVAPNDGPYFVFNDNLQRDCMRVLLLAARRFDDGPYLDAARRNAEFLLRAQLPEPQPGWAQTFDRTLTPVWGRKFEPPAVASRETAGTIEALLEAHAVLGDPRLLAAAQRAAAWLERVRLPGGNWARFYELGTDRPLYVDAAGHLTYDTNDLHPGYGFSGRFEIPRVLKQVEAVAAGRKPRPPRWWANAADAMSGAELRRRAATLVAAQDERGRWVEDGWVESATFVDAIFVLARVIEAGDRGDD